MTSHDAQDGPITKSYLAQNVSGAKVKTLLHIYILGIEPVPKIQHLLGACFSGLRTKKESVYKLRLENRIGKNAEST